MKQKTPERRGLPAGTLTVPPEAEGHATQTALSIAAAAAIAARALDRDGRRTAIERGQLATLRGLNRRLGVSRERLSELANRHPELFVPHGPRGSLLADVAAITNLLPQLPCERCGKPLGVVGSKRMHDDCVNDHRSETLRKWWDDLREEGKTRQFIHARAEARAAVGYSKEGLADEGRKLTERAQAECLAYRTERDLLTTEETARLCGVAKQTVRAWVIDEDDPLPSELVSFGQITWRLISRADAEGRRLRVKDERRAGTNLAPRHLYDPTRPAPLWRHADVAAWARANLGLSLEGTEGTIDLQALRRLLRVSRSSATRHSQRPDFPAPMAMTVQKPRYSLKSVQRWKGSDASKHASIPSAKRAYVRALRDQGRTMRDIARIAGVSLGSVKNIIDDAGQKRCSQRV